MADKLAVFGDMHLAKRTWAKYTDICDDAELALTECVSHAIQNKADAVFLGDQFDVNYPSVAMVQVWMQQMDRLENSGLKAYIIDGNHDPGTQLLVGDSSSDRSWSCLHPNVIHMQGELGQVYDVGGLAFTGFDYLPYTKTKDLVTSVCELAPDVAFIHQFPKQYTTIQMDCVSDIDLDTCEKPINFFCGHIHTPFEGPLLHGGKLFVVGSTNPRSVAETTTKCWYLLSKDKKTKTVTIEKKPLFSRGVFRAVCLHVDDLDTTLIQVKDFLDKTPTSFKFAKNVLIPIVEVSYDTAIPDMSKKLTDVTAGRAHLFERPKFSSNNISLVKTASDAMQAVSLRDVVDKQVENEPMKKIMVQMINNPDDSSVLLDEYVKALKSEKD